MSPDPLRHTGRYQVRAHLVRLGAFTVIGLTAVVVAVTLFVRALQH